jgi:Family of unknown function (DUF5317)
LAALAGLLIGWARGGHASALGQVALKGGWLLSFTALLVLAARLPPFSPIGPALQSFAYAGAMVVLWQNRRLPWIPVVLAGLALNSLVMWLNGGRMPLSGAALAAAAQGVHAPIGAFADPRYVVASPGAPLAALGDVFPIRIAGYYSAVVSAGDLLMSLGLAGFLQRHMAKSSAPELPSPTP